MSHTIPFIFSDTPPQTADSFVMTVPANLATKQDLLNACYEAGNFPGYFGNNWDALSDCLRDFSWIADKSIVIFHTDVPLKNDPENCQTYLEILAEALASWKDSDKKFAVVFPESAKDFIGTGY